MIKIFIGENSGFCFGVKRAIDKAEEIAKHSKVATLGYVIHNPQAIERLKRKGVQIIEDPNNFRSTDLNGTELVIRTHGVRKEMYEQLKRSGLKFFDATCPFVIRSQRIVEKFSSLGYSVVIFGDPNHPEVVGVVSFSKSKNIFVVRKPEEVDNIPFTRKVIVVSQTTQKLDDFTEVVKKVLQKAFEVRVFNTVCEVTVEAQREAKEIAELSDVVMVVGGKMSSNTDKLYKVCKDLVKSYKIETADEIQQEWIQKAEKIGIVAGTSTPDFIIKDVIRKIEEIKRDSAEIIRIGRKNRFSAEHFEWE